MKICGKCKVPKSNSEFHRCTKNKVSGLQSWCKVCVSKRDRGRRKERLNTYLKWKYGVSLKEKRKMLKEQDGRCAICKAKISLYKSHLDHDHVTEKIRGILCSNCNLALSLLKEDISICKNMARYIEVHK